MILFCLLWTPLFYLFWRSLSGDIAGQGGIWALILGAVFALFRFFLGSFITPGGFGLSRWISGLVDFVALPAALPFIICLIFALFRIIPLQSNFTNFAFLWLIPIAAVRTLSWSSQNDPLLLLGVPILWTAIVTGMGFFVRIIQNGWSWAVIPCVLGAAAIPVLAATAYWALFAQNTVLGIGLLAITALPAIISLVLSFVTAIGGAFGKA
jgi:hypothetical protein